MADIQVQRRHITKDYYESTTRGYFGSPATGVGGGVERHWEIGRVTLVTGDSNNFIHYFNKAFSSAPIGISNLKVYRWEEFTTGRYGMSDVLFTFTQFMAPYGATQYGFQILIDPTEDINGVIIDWMFTG